MDEDGGSGACGGGVEGGGGSGSSGGEVALGRLLAVLVPALEAEACEFRKRRLTENGW